MWWWLMYQDGGGGDTLHSSGHNKDFQLFKQDSLLDIIQVVIMLIKQHLRV